ncbi:hypothetical protein F5Y19DRAFT_478036 [Xylariaceae sp. FL1651]|nr:hypothetical protein F5Y19DRAFT_478036 [Xylariaceae sp. FL1651]
MLDIRQTQPPLIQPVWTVHRGRLPGKSHFHRHRERDWFPLPQHRLVDTTGYHIDHNRNRTLFQRRLQQIMEDQGLYQQGIDSGDEVCSLNDFYAESLPLAGMGTPNVGGQTPAPAVSAANSGREAGPSHPQFSNKGALGNEQMFFSGYPAANAYAQDLTSSFSQQQFQYPSYNANALCDQNVHIDFAHGLPSSADMYSNMPVFAEPLDYSHVGPGTLNSSFSSSAGSSIASEKMASMTLESASSQGSAPPMGFPSGHHASTPGIQAHSWGGGCPATISPKMLRINPSPTPTSSSESIRTGILTASGDSDIGSSAWDQQPIHNVLPTKRLSHKPRKELPTKSTKSRLAPSASCGSISSKSKTLMHTHSHNHYHPPTRQPDLAPLKPMPEGFAVAEVRSPVDAVPSSSVDIERDAKNQFLVDSKRAGMTYREIRRQGKFTEAESTLRGRFRTLTKNKEQRVRKPEWQDKDIRLLKRAVRKLAKGDEFTSAKVPWKQVAAYIYEHDGSYHFGNATCRKKWDELVQEGAAGLP